MRLLETETEIPTCPICGWEDRRYWTKSWTGDGCVVEYSCGKCQEKLSVMMVEKITYITNIAGIQ